LFMFSAPGLYNNGYAMGNQQNFINNFNNPQSGFNNGSNTNMINNDSYNFNNMNKIPSPGAENMNNISTKDSFNSLNGLQTNPPVPMPHNYKDDLMEEEHLESDMKNENPNNSLNVNGFNNSNFQQSNNKRKAAARNFCR